MDKWLYIQSLFSPALTLPLICTADRPIPGMECGNIGHAIHNILRPCAVDKYEGHAHTFKLFTYTMSSRHSLHS